MTISELIKHLEQIKEENGDIKVCAEFEETNEIEYVVVDHVNDSNEAIAILL